MQEKINHLTKRVLFVSPYFPPHRAVGTKRAIAFTQGVHGYEDWEVIVLASRALNDNNNDKLNDHIPDGVIVDYGFVGILRPIIELLSGGIKKKKPPLQQDEVVKPPKDRSPSKQKGLLTPFDQYLWDVGSAVRNGKKLIRKYKPDVIWVNADPWSGFLVGDRLSRKFGIPWVADLRDPWMLFSKKFDLKPTFTRRMIRRYERKFFGSASKVVLNTENASKKHQEVYPEFAEKFTFIRNAFNQNVIDETGEVEKNEIFTFGYYGGFRFFVPSNYILRGFAEFVKKNKLNPSQVRLEVRGGVYTDFWNQLEEHGIEDYVHVLREISADKGISLLRSWDVLLLGVIKEVDLMIPSKFYDYLYAGKPIFAVSDNMELNGLIDQSKSGSWAETNDLEKIVGQFERYYQKGRTSLLENKELIEPFGHKSQALRFCEVLNESIKNKTN